MMRGIKIALAAILLFAVQLAAQASPALSTLTGPYRQPPSFVSLATLKDSIDALEARILAGGDSAYLAGLIADLEARFEADSAAKVDTTRFKADSTAQALRMDSLCIVRRPAAEITRPGYFAAPTDSGYWKLADTLVTTKAGGVFLDSVAAGDSVNIQYHGLISFARWSGLLSIGEEAVSDSTDAGWLCPTDSMRTNTKKMQTYGVALDATTLMLRFGEVWVWQE